MLPIPSYENSRDVNWPEEINFMLSLYKWLTQKHNKTK